MKNKKGQEGWIFGIVITLFILIIFLLFSLRIIQFNEYAFEKEFGHLKEKPLHTGFNYIGIGSAIRVNNQIRNYEIEVESASKDFQQIDLILNLNIRLKSNKAYDFIKNYENEETYNQYLNNKVQEKVKFALLKYNAGEFLTNRIQISHEISNEIRNIQELEYFEINDVAIKNIAFSEEYNRILEQKAQVLVEREIIQRQKENIILINQNIAMTDIDSYFKYQMIEKWDGKSPIIFLGGLNG